MRAEPNGFLVHHLSHSVTLSVPTCQILSDADRPPGSVRCIREIPHCGWYSCGPSLSVRGRLLWSIAPTDRSTAEFRTSRKQCLAHAVALCTGSMRCAAIASAWELRLVDRIATPAKITFGFYTGQCAQVETSHPILCIWDGTSYPNERHYGGIG